MVKGQVIGHLYPKPELRMSGDIDFLVKETSSMVQVFPKLVIPEKLKGYEFGFDYHGISYEMHVNLRSFARRKHQEVWDCFLSEEWQNVNYIEIEGVNVRPLSPTFNAIYICTFVLSFYS